MAFVVIENDPDDPAAAGGTGDGLGKAALPWPAFYDRSGTDRNGDPHGGTSDFPGDVSYGAGDLLIRS